MCVCVCVCVCVCATLDKSQSLSNTVFLDLFKNQITFFVIVCKVLNRKTMQVYMWNIYETPAGTDTHAIVSVLIETAACTMIIWAAI